MRTNRSVWFVLATMALAGCNSGHSRGIGEAEARPRAPAKQAPAPPTPNVAALAQDLAEPEEPVHVFEKGRHVKVMEHLEALRQGYTVVDLSNDWAPYILGDCQHGGQCFRNDYRETFVALANRRPIPEGAIDPEGPYLELFGINPTLSLIKKRIAEDAGKECLRSLSYEALREFDGFLAYQPGTDSGSIKKQAQSTRYGATRQAKKLGLDGPDALAHAAGQERLYERYHEADVRMRALYEAQDRITCEGLVPRGAKMRRGVFDLPTHLGLAAFERKNRVFGWGFVGRDTIPHLRQPPEDGHYQTFLRMLEERIADGAHVLEDGSVSGMRGAPESFRTMDGHTEPLRNVLQEYRDTLLGEMGLETREKFLAFIVGKTDEQLERFKVAIRMPALPAYYSPNMELSVEVDRGDVWYDFPWDSEGNPIPQPVIHRPHLTLYTTYNGQRIPLVHYGTTIGGWRSERVNGQDYYAYKNSDVGARVWRNILAAPIWIPPDSTPLEGLLTDPSPSGRRKVNYQEFGPGYASAYGLVAAFNEQPVTRPDGTTVYFDYGVRTHGSVDYMSIMQRHSHGCHRLYNHLAIRLFDYVLRHRTHEVVGQTRVEYGREFEVDDVHYRLALHSRGYLFQLTPPVPVNVLDGRIMGRVHRPIEEPMRKPGVVYQEDLAMTTDPLTGLPIQTVPVETSGGPASGPETPTPTAPESAPEEGMQSPIDPGSP